MTLFVQVIGAFLAVATIAVLNGVPKKFLGYSGIVGAAGWLVYLICIQVNVSEVLSMFFATLAVALISHIFARLFKAPVTLFLVCGILPLVPGVGMYRIAYYLMHSDTATAWHYALRTISIAGAIALAVFLVDTCFKLRKPHFWARTNNIKKQEDEK